MENPFSDDWQTLEKVAMISLASQLQARNLLQLMTLKDLRSGAKFQNCDAVKIIIPDRVVFSVLTTHLGVDDTRRPQV